MSNDDSFDFVSGQVVMIDLLLVSVISVGHLSQAGAYHLSRYSRLVCSLYEIGMRISLHLALLTMSADLDSNTLRDIS